MLSLKIVSTADSAQFRDYCDALYCEVMERAAKCQHK